MEKLTSFILSKTTPVKKFSTQEFFQDKGIYIDRIKTFKDNIPLPGSVAVVFYDNPVGTSPSSQRMKSFSFRYYLDKYCQKVFAIQEDHINEASLPFLKVIMDVDKIDNDFKLEVFYRLILPNPVVPGVERTKNISYRLVSLSAVPKHREAGSPTETC